MEEGEKHATIIGECPSTDTLVLRWEVYRYVKEYSFALARKDLKIKIKTSKQPIGVRCVTLAKRWLLMDAQALGVRIGVIVDTNDLVFLLV